MPRPMKCRRVEFFPDVESFLPTGTGTGKVKEYTIKVEELEAMRLKDVENMSQEDCADRMHVSRQTFQKIIETARKKVALALMDGAAIRISGGCFVSKTCRLLCADCGNSYDPDVEEDKLFCPKCGSRNIDCMRKNSNCKKWCSQ